MNKVLLGTLCILFMLPLAASAAIIGENCPSPIDRSKVPAFPGADGAGKYTTGGAGGAVYTVTSLADDGSKEHSAGLSIKKVRVPLFSRSAGSLNSRNH